MFQRSGRPEGRPALQPCMLDTWNATFQRSGRPEGRPAVQGRREGQHLYRFNAQAAPKDGLRRMVSGSTCPRRFNAQAAPKDGLLGAHLDIGTDDGFNAQAAPKDGLLAGGRGQFTERDVSTLRPPRRTACCVTSAGVTPWTCFNAQAAPKDGLPSTRFRRPPSIRFQRSGRPEGRPAVRRHMVFHDGEFQRSGRPEGRPAALHRSEAHAGAVSTLRPPRRTACVPSGWQVVPSVQVSTLRPPRRTACLLDQVHMLGRADVSTLRPPRRTACRALRIRGPSTSSVSTLRPPRRTACHSEKVVRYAKEVSTLRPPRRTACAWAASSPARPPSFNAQAAPKDGLRGHVVELLAVVAFQRSGRPEGRPARAVAKRNFGNVVSTLRPPRRTACQASQQARET